MTRRRSASKADGDGRETEQRRQMWSGVQGEDKEMGKWKVKMGQTRAAERRKGR